MEDLSGQIEQLQEEILKIQSDVEKKRQQIQQIQEEQLQLQQLKKIQEEQEKLIKELQQGTAKTINGEETADNADISEVSEADEENDDSKNDVRKNLSLEEVQAQLAEFGNNLHEKNKKRIHAGLWCIAVIPLVFMILMFSMDTAKVVYLLLWVISLFVLCTYLVVVDYIDDRLQRRLDELNIEITHSQLEFMGSDLRAFFNSVMNDEE